MNKSEPTKYRLRYSQLEALALLLCEGNVDTRETTYRKDKLQGVRSNQRPFYGPFKSPNCSGSLRAIDQMLVMFGGNDTGFSRVVLQTVDPRNLDYRVALAGAFINSGIAQKLNPVSAEYAYRMGVVQVPELLRQTNLELRKLNVSPEKVTLGIYPDLVQDLPERSSQLLQQCNERTADGFSTLQILLREEAGHAGSRFGLRTGNLKLLRDVRDIYIGNLQNKQRQGAMAVGWKTLETNLVFTGRDVCAVSAECRGDQCPLGDKVRWAWTHFDQDLIPWSDSICKSERDRKTEGLRPELKSHTVHDCSTRPIPKLSEFNPYDPTMTRGVRYATDAMLATANREEQAPHGEMYKKNRYYFSEDGVYGLAHPTAHMHARIADLLEIGK